MNSQQEKKEKLRIFSERLKMRLAKTGTQQNELAEKLKVAPAAVSNWIQGVNAAKGRNLRKLAELLEVDPEWLLGGGVSYRIHARTHGAPNDMRPEDEIRRKAHGHLERVLDDCHHDLERLRWTYIELTRRLPTRSGTSSAPPTER